MLTATGIKIEVGDEETVATFPYVVTDEARPHNIRLLAALIDIRPGTDIEWVSMRKVVLVNRETMSEYVLRTASQFRSREHAAAYLAQAIRDCKRQGVHHSQMEPMRRRFLALSGHKALAAPSAGRA